jgi:hypothetical protein
MKVVTKYQISAINSCSEKCNNKYLGMDGRTDGKTDRQKDGQMEGRTDRWTDGWMDRWTDGRTEGRWSEGIIIVLCSSIIFQVKCYQNLICNIPRYLH